MGPISIWDVMKDGKVQETYLAQLPEELLPLAKQYQTVLEEQYQKLTEKILAECNLFIATYNRSPKEIGINKKALSPIAQRAVFAVLKNEMSKVDKVVMDYIYPSGNNFVTE